MGPVTMADDPTPPPLAALRTAEARLLHRRAGPPDLAGAVAEALAAAWGGPPPPDLAAAGARIAAAVERHGAGFPHGTEPPYHDRHHQAEATLAAGWLTRAAREAGALAPRAAVLSVLALAGHDLLHDGSCGGAPGALEARSADAAAALAPEVTTADRAEIRRLILATDPTRAAPDDLCGRLVREADLFASLTPHHGLRLSEALAREWREADPAAAARVGRFAGRLDLLRRMPPCTAAGEALGLEAGRALQLAALAAAGEAADPAEGAARLDTLPRAAALARYRGALAARGWPEPPA